MTLRDDLEGCVDDARSIVDDLGLRPHVVTVRTTTWSGGRPGSGTASNSDLVIDPPPRVREPSVRMQFAEAGKYQNGDRVADKISRSYTEAQLTGGSLAAGAEQVWLIDSDEYRLVGEPLKRNFEWRVQLRRMTD